MANGYEVEIHRLGNAGQLTTKVSSDRVVGIAAASHGGCMEFGPGEGYVVFNVDVGKYWVGASEGFRQGISPVKKLGPLGTDPHQAFLRGYFGHCYISPQGKVGDVAKCIRMYADELQVHAGRIMIPRPFWGPKFIDWEHLEWAFRRFYLLFPPCCPLWRARRRSQ